MRKKIIACMLVLAVAVAFMPTAAFAAHKVKMKTYNDVLKSKNTVYCAGAAGLYKVKLKKGKVKSKKLIFRGPDVDGCYSNVGKMKKKGKYIYFVSGENNSDEAMLFRIKTNGKSKKHITNTGWYVIKGKKLYTTEYEPDPTYYRDFIVHYYKMTLTGKKKKETKTKVRMTDVFTNAKGYRMDIRESKGYAYDYLVTPKGKYPLGTVKMVPQVYRRHEGK